MNKILNVYKPVGLSPYQLIQKLREKFPEFKNEKIGFAGRLDPLAHGVMLLMIGNATKNRQKYLNFPKEYEFQVLFGVTTDTYDVLGYLENEKVKRVPEDLEKQMKEFTKRKIGKQNQKYPPYSSKTVGGKPLYWWARSDRLSELKIPEREVEIYNFELFNIKNVPAGEIEKLIVSSINSVNGDFRQEETLKMWAKFFSIYSSSERSESRSSSSRLARTIKPMTVAKFKIKCSSGTYVRSLALELGKELGTGGIALDIMRTSVGDYKADTSLKL